MKVSSEALAKILSEDIKSMTLDELLARDDYQRYLHIYRNIESLTSSILGSLEEPVVVSNGCIYSRTEAVEIMRHAKPVCRFTSNALVPNLIVELPQLEASIKGLRQRYLTRETTSGAHSSSGLVAGRYSDGAGRERSRSRSRSRVPAASASAAVGSREAYGNRGEEHVRGSGAAAYSSGMGGERVERGRGVEAGFGARVAGGRIGDRERSSAAAAPAAGGFRLDAPILAFPQLRGSTQVLGAASSVPAPAVSAVSAGRELPSLVSAQASSSAPLAGRGLASAAARSAMLDPFASRPTVSMYAGRPAGGFYPGEWQQARPLAAGELLAVRGRGRAYRVPGVLDAYQAPSSSVPLVSDFATQAPLPVGEEFHPELQPEACLTENGDATLQPPTRGPGFR